MYCGVAAMHYLQLQSTSACVCGVATKIILFRYFRIAIGPLKIFNEALYFMNTQTCAGENQM